MHQSLLSRITAGQMVCPFLETVLKMLCVCDMQTLHALESTGTGVASVAFGPEGTVLYSSPLLQKLIEFDHEQDRVLRNINMHCNATALNVSLCGSAVAFADANGAVGLFRYQGGELFLLQGTTSRFDA